MACGHSHAFQLHDKPVAMPSYYRITYLSTQFVCNFYLIALKNLC